MNPPPPFPTVGPVADRRHPMTVRTTKSTVTFANAFMLGDFDEMLPPGQYDVEIDEELLEGLSFDAYRKVLTLVHLPAKSGHPSLSRTLTINPGELDAALTRDAAASDQASARKAPKARPKPGEAEIDRRAVDRAEDEGMIVQPH